MTDQEIAEKVLNSVENRKKEFEVIKKGVQDYITGIMLDLGDILQELDTFQKFGNVVIEIIDEKTDTGIFDVIDSLIAKQILGFVNNSTVESWYIQERKKILEGLANATR
jgi:hypothetical protein